MICSPSVSFEVFYLPLD